MEQHDTGTGHHMVPSGTAVRLSRKDAWARFLAYEVGFIDIALHFEKVVAFWTFGSHSTAILPMTRYPAPDRKFYVLDMQGAFQVCLRHVLEDQSAEARGFLLDGCQALRQAFAFDGLLLDPSSGSQQCESNLVW